MKINLFCSILTAVCCGSILCGSENMLVNGDFESGIAPWNIAEWSTPSGKVKCQAVTGEVHSGKQAAEITHISGGSNIVLGQHIAVSSQKNLLLEFFAKADVRVSTSTDISASFVTVDKNNQKLQYQIKRFTATDNWQKFSWKIALHASAAKMAVYLRCGRKRIWFDDVVLKKFSGINLTGVQIWYPEQEVIPSLIPSDDQAAQVTVLIRNARDNKVLQENKLVLSSDSHYPVLKVPNIYAGKWLLEVRDAANAVSTASFSWPQENPPVPNRLNNFVTILYPRQSAKITHQKPLTFANPREGWLYIKLRSNADAVLSLPGSSGNEIKLPGGQTVEVMRYAPKGKLTLTTAATPVMLQECEIRTMPELIFCEYEGMPSRNMYSGLMQSPAGQLLLGNTNMLMEGFEGADSINTESVSAAAAQRIREYLSSGKQIISHASRTTAANKKIKLADTAAFWSSRIGMQQFNGTAIDEFAHETPEELQYYCQAVKAINSDPKLTGKRLYAYSCAAWDTHKKSVEFRKLLLAGSGIFAPEFYLREKRSIGESKSYINSMMDYLRNWPKSLPNSLERLVIVLSCTDGLPNYYGQDTFANVMYKYFLDLQYNMLANDPQFADLRGLTAWIVRYAKPETVAWMAMLNRHYCIEGNKDLLSNRLGFSFELPYLRNPDFRNNADGWKLQEAAPGSIRHLEVPNWGFAAAPAIPAVTAMRFCCSSGFRAKATASARKYPDSSPAAGTKYPAGQPITMM